MLLCDMQHRMGQIKRYNNQIVTATKQNIGNACKQHHFYDSSQVFKFHHKFCLRHAGKCWVILVLGSLYLHLQILEQIDTLSDEEFEKLHSRFEMRLGVVMTQALG